MKTPDGYMVVPGSPPHRRRALGIWWPSWRKPRGTPLTAAHCSIVAVDVAGFGAYHRNNTNQARIRQGLYGSVQWSLEASNIPWRVCHREDRGDGLLVLVPAGVSKALLADGFPQALLAALAEHNGNRPSAERIRLRVALHAGEVLYDAHGVTSCSINHAFRLLDSRQLRDALDQSSAVIAVISSSWFYEEVIRHSERSQSADYRQVAVVNKETRAPAWVRTLGS